MRREGTVECGNDGVSCSRLILPALNCWPIRRCDPPIVPGEEPPAPAGEFITHRNGLLTTARSSRWPPPMGCRAGRSSGSGRRDLAADTPDRRGNRDPLGLEFGQEFTKPLQVRLFYEQRQIEVAAKLRCAVQHAGLSTHQQTLHLVRPDRRKDSAYRAPGQAALRSPGSGPTASPTRPTAAAASARTTRAIPAQ